MFNVVLVTLTLSLGVVIFGALSQFFSNRGMKKVHRGCVVFCFLFVVLLTSTIYVGSVYLLNKDEVVYKELSSDSYNIKDCSIQLKKEFVNGRFTAESYLFCRNLTEEDISNFMKCGSSNNSISLIVLYKSKEVYTKRLIQYQMSDVNDKNIKSLYRNINVLLKYINNSDRIVIKRVRMINANFKLLGWDKTEIDVE